MDTDMASQTTLVAHNDESLNPILDLVHDRDFTISEVIFDRVNARVTIPLSVIYREHALTTRRRWGFVVLEECPVLEAELRLYDVSDCSIEDRAEIDQGNVNEIRLSSEEIVVTSGLPVEIRMKASSPRVELEVSDKAIGRNRYFFLSMKD